MYLYTYMYIISQQNITKLENKMEMKLIEAIKAF